MAAGRIAVRAGVFVSIAVAIAGLMPTQDAAADRADRGAATPQAPLTPDAASGRVPVVFEMNRGQAPDGWDFLVRAHGYRAFVRSDEILFSFGGAALRMTHDGAGRVAPDVGGFETPGRVNYLIGDDPSQWRTGVPVTRGAAYHDAVAGSSWTADGDGRSMRMAWAFEGDGEPRFHLDGSSALRVGRDGSLRAALPTGEATFTAPVAWQEKDGTRRSVTAAFELGEGGAVRVALGERDLTRTTFIDPTVEFVSYFGGTLDEKVTAVALDSSGGTFLGGHSKSTGLPTSSGAYATAHANDSTSNDMFVVKFDSTGRSFVWCTYVGGNAADDCVGFGVTASGQSVLIGNSNSTDLPTTSGVIGAANASAATLGALVKLNASGAAVVACSYFPLGSLVSGALAGDERLYLLDADNLHRVMDTFRLAPDMNGTPKFTTEWTHRITPTTHTGSESTTLVGVATGGAGEAVVYGVSNDTTFSTTSGAYQAQPTSGGSKDVLLVRYEPVGTRSWSTFLGGSGDDVVTAVVIDPVRRPIVLGATNSSDFPTTTYAYQPEKDSGYDAFVARMSGDGSSLIESTYLGGGGDDRTTAAAFHISGATFVGGVTTSSDFPLKAAPTGVAYAGGTNGDAFVTVFDSAQRLAASSYVGGTGDDAVTGIAVRPDSTVVIAGMTTSSDLPTTNAFQPQYGGSIDGWYVQASDALVGTIDAPRVTTTADDVPAWTVGEPYSVALQATDGRTPYKWTLTSGALPPGLTLAEDGTVSGTLTTTGSYGFSVTVRDAYAVRGYATFAIIVHLAPVVTTAAVPDVTRATPFDFQLVWAFGTVSPAGPAFTVASGALPEGLELSASGRITGTPTTLGPSTFTVVLTDDVGATATKTYTVTVHEAPTVDDATLDPWTEGQAWVHSFTAQDGTPPLTWSLVSGSLPIAGGIDPASGRVQGTAKAAATYDFTLRAQDARGAASERAFSIVVNPAPQISTTNLPPAAVGRRYAAVLGSIGGTLPATWKIDAGVLPRGVKLTAETGAVEGAPTKAGTSYLLMLLTDATGASVRKAIYFDAAAPLDVRKKRGKFTFQVAIGAPTRTVRWLELVAGTVLNVTMKGGGVRGDRPELHLHRPDASEVDLKGFVKTSANGVTLKRFPVPATGRWFLAIETATAFRGRITAAATIAPAAKWSARVGVDAAAEPVEAFFAAPPGTRVSVTVAPAKGSRAKPVIADVLGERGQSMLARGKRSTKGRTVTFTLRAPVAGGDYRVLLSAAAGSPGDVVWTAKLGLPKSYGFSQKNVPAGDEEQP